MLSAGFAAIVAFVVTIVGLRGLEWAYHKLRHTADWSPHWGSWVFAVLAGLWAGLANLGR